MDWANFTSFANTNEFVGFSVQQPSSSNENRVELMRSRRFAQKCAYLMAATILLSGITGCYVPLRSPGIAASSLGPEFRSPSRTFTPRVNFATVATSTPEDYIIGPNDTLELIIPTVLEREGEQTPAFRVRVVSDGTIRLPLVGKVNVGGKNLSDVQAEIEKAYAKNILVDPRVSVSIFEEAKFEIAVLGEVKQPGVYEFSKNEVDIAHAIAQAGGLTEFAAEAVEIHRRMADRDLVRRLPKVKPALAVWQEGQVLPPPGTGEWLPIVPGAEDQPITVVTVPLRGEPPRFCSADPALTHRIVTEHDLALRRDDVIVVPRKPDEVFFVVGPLSEINSINYAVSDQDRQLGNALMLPRDRDIDVITAVAMAGYIDPINSPSTVSVQRSVPGGPPMLIRVDLIAARYDWNENIYVQPNDIIYLNPDAAWWSRRLFDQIAPDLLLIPYAESMIRLINPIQNFR